MGKVRLESPFPFPIVPIPRLLQEQDFKLFCALLSTLFLSNGMSNYFSLRLDLVVCWTRSSTL